MLAAPLLLILAADWTPQRQMEVRTFAEVLPSPDGKAAAWIERGPNEWTLRYRGVGPGQTLLKAAKSIANLSFALDGQTIFAQHDGAWKQLTLDGRVQLIITEVGASGFALSPDGKRVAYLRTPSSKRSLPIRVMSEMPARPEVCVAELDAIPARKCWAVPGYASGLQWGPHSKSVSFESRPTPFADDARKSDLYLLNAATGQSEALAKTGATEAQPRYSPDGLWMAWVESEDPPLMPGEGTIVLYDRVKQTKRRLPATQDQLPTLLGFTADSKRILYEEDRGTRNAVYAMPLDGPPQSAYVPAGVVSALRLNATGTALGFALESSDTPPEAQLKPLDGDPRALSESNADAKSVRVGKTEVFWWRSRDNVEVEGLITYPANVEAGKKYPLILLLHGGPYGHFEESFLGKPGLYPLATFSAKGYVVFRPNPRASTGYGRAFRYLNLKDWGGLDYQDVMMGLRAVIGLGMVDEQRMAVMGWSYGGFLTNWTITHSKQFKAAVSGAGVSNLWSQTGTSDIRANKMDAWGEPWVNPQFYIERSPLTHVQNVTTPTLFLHGDADPRVPLSQSLELYHALQRRGIETDLVIYPGALHVPSGPDYVVDIMQRHLAWVEKYVGKAQ
jgi:dipeptidyl aminopeptidase/acylaminoacyl peptidase